MSIHIVCDGCGKEMTKTEQIIWSGIRKKLAIVVNGRLIDQFPGKDFHTLCGSKYNDNIDQIVNPVQDIDDLSIIGDVDALAKLVAEEMPNDIPALLNKSEEISVHHREIRYRVCGFDKTNLRRRGNPNIFDSKNYKSIIKFERKSINRRVLIPRIKKAIDEKCLELDLNTHFCVDDELAELLIARHKECLLAKGITSNNEVQIHWFIKSKR